mmetsp:Transcript_29951/g.54558  ORF Transcript_29951/g.54558 Transcript_29951/m.54558 type:complete len:578 (-) Transcript_29951:94-1827(-)
MEDSEEVRVPRPRSCSCAGLPDDSVILGLNPVHGLPNSLAVPSVTHCRRPQSAPPGPRAPTDVSAHALPARASMVLEDEAGKVRRRPKSAGLCSEPSYRPYKTWSMAERMVVDGAMPPVVEDVQCCYPARPSSAPPVRNTLVKNRPATPLADFGLSSGERKHRLLAELQEALALEEISEWDVQGVLGAPTSAIRPGSAGSSSGRHDALEYNSTTSALAARRSSTFSLQPSDTSTRLNSKLLAEHSKNYAVGELGDLDGGISEGSTVATPAARVPWLLGRMAEVRHELLSPSVQSRSSKPSCKSFGRSWSASSDASAAPFAKFHHGMLPVDVRTHLRDRSGPIGPITGYGPGPKPVLGPPFSTLAPVGRSVAPRGPPSAPRLGSQAIVRVRSRPSSASSVPHACQRQRMTSAPSLTASAASECDSADHSSLMQVEFRSSKTMWPQAAADGGERLHDEHSRSGSAPSRRSVPGLNLADRRQHLLLQHDRSNAVALTSHTPLARNAERSLPLPDAIRRRVHALALRANRPGGLRPATPAKESGLGCAAQSSSNWMGRGLLHGRDQVFKMEVPVGDPFAPR